MSGPSALGHEKPATMYDVAALAGVSHQTVSRVLRGFTGIRPETRHRVEAAIDSLRYRPNATARALATRRPQRIGVIATGMSEYGPMRSVAGAAHRARQSGYLLDVLYGWSGSVDADAALDALDHRELAGILAVAPTTQLIKALEQATFSLPVRIDTESNERSRTVARSVSGRGVAQLVDHLAALGHRRLLHVSGPDSWVSARHRAEALRATARRHGMVCVGTVPGDWSARSGHLAATGFTEDHLSATAVVAANDQMAMGVVRGLHDRGWQVPQEMSVVGFDDLPEAAFTTPNLTTVAVDFEALGSAAVAELIADIEGAARPRRTQSQVSLRVRESTAAPRPRDRRP
ncbi:MAG: LacI family DNA-binding transcriptional regulator [Dermatophilaceae bacterium]